MAVIKATRCFIYLMLLMAGTLAVESTQDIANSLGLTEKVNVHQVGLLI